ncbi:MAG TPA: hypothetical protein VG034_14610 [Acidimicrobiia bacterium]|nr:hypothetical protein [Acidimicrobiia bacterium]
MLKRISAVLLSAGLFLGLTPAVASAHHRDDDHYRCMYQCSDRHDRYDRYRYGYPYGYCWYHDRYGWYQARCGGHKHHDHDRDGDDGYDSHRHHPR